MESYLRDYIAFMSDSNKFATISDTEKYVSMNDFDIKYIVKAFHRHMDLDSIYELVDSTRFYKGHKQCDKYALLIHFFYVLHNYSKNLMLNYGLYSSKSIQESSGNVKDCLVHIPHYRDYLSELLGYEFQADTNEWLIPDDESPLTDKRQQKLGAVCILCAHGHQVLTTMKNDTQFPDESSDTASRSSVDNLEPLNDTWNCHGCTFTNSDKDSNCLVCYIPRNQNSTDVPIAKTPVEKVDSNKWQCTSCTFLNELLNSHCGVCGQAKIGTLEHLPNLPDLQKEDVPMYDTSSSVDTDQESPKSIPKDKQHSQHPYMKSVSHTPKPSELPIESELRKHKSEDVVTSKSQEKWTCKKCTFVNRANDLSCGACLENRQNSPIAKVPIQKFSHSPKAELNGISKSPKSDDKIPPTLTKQKKLHEPIDFGIEDNQPQNLRARGSPQKPKPKPNDIDIEVVSHKPSERSQIKRNSDHVNVIANPKSNKSPRVCRKCNKDLDINSQNEEGRNKKSPKKENKRNKKNPKKEKRNKKNQNKEDELKKKDQENENLCNSCLKKKKRSFSFNICNYISDGLNFISQFQIYPILIFEHTSFICLFITISVIYFNL